MTTYVLALAPSTNALYHNNKNGGRSKTKAYLSWIRGELKALVAQRAKPIEGRVSIAITVPKATRGDCENRSKATVDLLVRAGIIPDDNGKCVGSVSTTFGDVQMMHVEIKPMVTA